MTLPTFPEMRPGPGDSLDDLDTPAVVADLDVMDRNIEAYRDLADEHGVTVRSHTKAHKVPAIARRQESAFDGGVLCQKLSEAEVMARNGIEDVLLVCPVVSEAKLERLLWVVEHTERFATMVDGPGNVSPLQEAAAAAGTTVGVVLELDMGIRRMGVPPGEDAVEVAAFIEDQPNLELRGLLGHDAHVTYTADTEAEYREGCREVGDDLAATVEALAGAGIEAGEVITGCSATAPFVAAHDAVTQLDPGRYVFNDADLLENRVDVGIEDCGATVVTTVISRPTEDRAIVDAGSKTISYVGSPDPVPKGRDDVAYYRKSSEHGYVDVGEADEPVEVGDRLEFVVPNLYGAINLQDTLPAHRDGRIEEVWHVEARGKDK